MGSGPGRIRRPYYDRYFGRDYYRLVGRNPAYQSTAPRPSFGPPNQIQQFVPQQICCPPQLPPPQCCFSIQFPQLTAFNPMQQCCAPPQLPAPQMFFPVPFQQNQQCTPAQLPAFPSQPCSTPVQQFIPQMPAIQTCSPQMPMMQPMSAPQIFFPQHLLSGCMPQISQMQQFPVQQIGMPFFPTPQFNSPFQQFLPQISSMQVCASQPFFPQSQMQNFGPIIPFQQSLPSPISTCPSQPFFPQLQLQNQFMILPFNLPLFPQLPQSLPCAPPIQPFLPQMHIMQQTCAPSIQSCQPQMPLVQQSCATPIQPCMPASMPAIQQFFPQMPPIQQCLPQMPPIQQCLPQMPPIQQCLPQMPPIQQFLPQMSMMQNCASPTQQFLSQSPQSPIILPPIILPPIIQPAQQQMFAPQQYPQQTYGTCTQQSSGYQQPAAYQQPQSYQLPIQPSYPQAQQPAYMQQPQYSIPTAPQPQSILPPPPPPPPSPSYYPPSPNYYPHAQTAQQPYYSPPAHTPQSVAPVQVAVYRPVTGHSRANYRPNRSTQSNKLASPYLPPSPYSGGSGHNPSPQFSFKSSKNSPSPRDPGTPNQTSSNKRTSPPLSRQGIVPVVVNKIADKHSTKSDKQ
jgi:hypothetical protein